MITNIIENQTKSPLPFQSEFVLSKTSQPQISFYSGFNKRRVKALRTEQILPHGLIRFNIAYKNTVRALAGHYTNFAAITVYRHDWRHIMVRRWRACHNYIITFLHALRLLCRVSFLSFSFLAARIPNPTRNIFSVMRSIRHCTRVF